VFSTNHSHLYAAQTADCMTPQGRFGLIDNPDAFDITPFKQKSLSVHWEFRYTRSLFQTEDMPSSTRWQA